MIRGAALGYFGHVDYLAEDAALPSFPYGLFAPNYVQQLKYSGAAKVLVWFECRWLSGRESEGQIVMV